MRALLVPLLPFLLACPSAQQDAAPADSAAPAAPAAALPAPTRDTVVLETGRGRIVLELDAAKAPESVANFLKHVRAGFYNGLIFHRIEPNFVIQAGAVTETARERTSTVYPVRNEAQNGLKNLRGTLAMARTGDPHSATSEFFINLKDNAGLDYRAPTLDGWGYAVFGRVIEGMDVVRSIEKVPTGNKGHHQDVPMQPVTINSAKLEQ